MKETVQIVAAAADCRPATLKLAPRAPSAAAALLVDHLNSFAIVMKACECLGIMAAAARRVG